jgi:C-terminal processing protease CtpA/Prc
MRRAPALALALAAVAAAAAGCSGDGPAPSLCTPAYEKSQVLSAARSWYLFPDLLPAQVDPAAFATAADLLDALTAGARAAGRDRQWSFLTTAQASDQYFAQGQAVGFGVSLLLRGSQLFVAQVFAGSAASDAGFIRGDEILAIGSTEAGLVLVTDLVASGTLGGAFGPAQAGVTRVFQVRTLAGTALRTATTRVFSLDPVPSYALLDRSPLPPAGYLSLRSFIQPAETRLREAFQSFRDQGVADVVVDLRYNGGGLLSIGELLADLLGGGLPPQPMYQLVNAPSKAALNATAPFQAQPQAVTPGRIAFVTTGASASASELVPNALEPYRSVALVGSRTYGKPVGQRGFEIVGCPSLLFLVSFQLRNAQGDGDYFGGLPDANFAGPLCQAEDDLLHAQGDPAEASTAAAMSWLETGTCPSPPVAFRLQRPTAPDGYPAPPRPSPAQVHLPGLF